MAENSLEWKVSAEDEVTRVRLCGGARRVKLINEMIYSTVSLLLGSGSSPARDILLGLCGISGYHQTR